MTTKKIGIISDTHYDPDESLFFPFDKIKSHFSNVDFIMHAGDIGSDRIIDSLSEITIVKAVSGNMDTHDLKNELPIKLTEDVNGVKIGLIHGFGPKSGLPEKLFPEFEEKLDLLIFGHTHEPFSKKVHGILCFNPGSPMKPADNRKPTIGIINIDDNKSIKTDIIELA